MAASTGKTGRAITFEIDDGSSPTTWVACANATGITPSGKNAEEIDFTHLTSTGGFREYRQGFKDAGTIGINYHLDPTDASHQQLLTLFESGDTFNWRVNFVGAGWNVHLTGVGFVQNPGDIDINVDGPVTGAATVRITGATEFVDV